MVNKHFCLDQLQSIAFFADASTCSSGLQEEHAGPSADLQFRRKSCCSDQCTLHKLTEEAVPQSDEGIPSGWTPIPPFPPVAIALEVHSFEQVRLRPLSFNPPLMVFDARIDLQVFRC